MFVKVCGLSTPESIREAVDAGADAVGFVLTASPRVVSPAHVTELLSNVPDGVAAVGVFRHEPVADAVAIARAAGLEWIQLHGDRTPEDVKTAHDAGMKLIRAVTMDAAPDAFANWGEELLLVDAAVPGSGESWDYGSMRDQGPRGTRTGCSPEGWIPQTSPRRPGLRRPGASTSPPASSSPGASRTWRRSVRS